MVICLEEDGVVLMRRGCGSYGVVTVSSVRFGEKDEIHNFVALVCVQDLLVFTQNAASPHNSRKTLGGGCGIPIHCGGGRMSLGHDHKRLMNKSYFFLFLSCKESKCVQMEFVSL